MTESEIQNQIQLLVAKMRKIEDDPKNKVPQGSSLFLYTKPARKKIDKIVTDIAHLTGELRKLRGNPVPCNGYSGRNSNRR